MLIGKLAVIGGAVLLSLGGAEAQSFSVYIGAPGAQETPHGGTAVETFNSGWTGGGQTGSKSSLGLTAFSGTYHFTGTAAASTGSIVPADQYGGADGTGSYIAMGQPWTGNDEPYSLTVTPANYFGFWWSAGDANNYVQFYNDGVFLAEFTTADVFTILGSGDTILASDGITEYETDGYYGNPNTPLGRNTSEPYAFVSIYATGLVFDEIRFDNGEAGWFTGFESDNHTLYNGPLTPIGTEVFVTNLPVPEPGTTVLFGIAGTCLLVFRRRRSS